jgi:hypothetical protein
LRRADIRELLAHEEYPSVSILMPTHRAHPETQQDPIRLKNLLAEARTRLTDEVGKRPAWPLLDRLDALADEVDWRANQDGLALFASDDFGAAYALPFTVEERVVVDGSFQTRELVAALNRTPRYRVLVLAEQPTRLFEGAGDVLDEAQNGTFPIARTGAGGATRGADGSQMQSSHVREAHLDAFFTEVDQALTEAAAEAPMPLVLIGTGRVLSTFEAVSSNMATVVARIEGSHDEANATAIAELAWPVLQEWLAAQREAVITELPEAQAANRLAAGLAESWETAIAGRGHKLVVEETFHQPALAIRSGTALRLENSPDERNGPDYLDDAVDELVEAVLNRSGEVVFVDDGALAAYERVALILRY